MRIAVFSTKPYDRLMLEEPALAQTYDPNHEHQWLFLEDRLRSETAELARGCEAVCVFVNDQVNAEVIAALAAQGARLVLLRCAGFNNVDLAATAQQRIRVARVPAYSPYAVAEHTLALIMTLNRKTHRAYNRVREMNFGLDGLLGFDLHGKTVGIIGTGKIGFLVGRMLHQGLGCHWLNYDQRENAEVLKSGGRYVDLNSLYANSDIISLHCPLSPSTHHMIHMGAIAQMKRGVMLINTSRGAVVDTSALIAGLKTGQIGSLGLDVYEEEADVFFEDLSGQVLKDDVLARLLTFPNVLITSHQAFFTKEALDAIARTTWENLTAYAAGRTNGNEVTA